MRSKTRETPAGSAAPGVIPDPGTGSISNAARAAVDSKVAGAEASAASADGRETRLARLSRKAHRTRLHGYAIASVTLVAFLIALAATNTARVKVHWVFGTSHVSLVWLVLFAAILGWMLGLVAAAAFHWRTRAPGRRRGTTS